MTVNRLISVQPTVFLLRFRPLLAVVLAFCLTFFTTACSGGSDTVKRAGYNVTYDDIRNTGKANDCPTISETSRGSIPPVSYTHLTLPTTR